MGDHSPIGQVDRTLIGLLGTLMVTRVESAWRVTEWGKMVLRV